MATITKTVTENMVQGEGRATWTVTHTGSNITVTGNSFTFTTPTVTAKYVYSGRSYGFAYDYLPHIYIGGVEVSQTTGHGWSWVKGTMETLVAMSSGTVYTIPKVTSFNGVTYEAHTKTLQTSTFFNATNKTARTLNITASNWHPALMSGSHQYPDNGYNTEQTGSIGTLATVTLNAPPTFNSTDVTLTGSPYAGYVTATATVSNLSAKYGGDISSAVLKIGSQTATRTTNGSFTPFTLTTAGTFTPTVTVTDSRGQVTTKNLAQITVLPYVVPNVSFNIERTTEVGVPNDEGESAVITTTFNYTDAVAHLTTPTIIVKDPDNLSVSVIKEWYSEREINGTFNSQNAISDWSEIEKGATIYCLIYNYKLTQDTSVISEKKYYTRTGSDPYVYTEVNNPSGNPMQQGWYEIGVFDTQDSYQIELTPNDIDINNVSHSGTIITQTLGSAFYTIDFLAGGHGIAFGQACTDDGFYCNMDAHFKDKAGVMRAMFDFFYPVGSYYETSDSTFNPNTAWGGTWVKDSAGRVTVAQNTSETEFDVVGETGGSKYIQNHAHGFTQPVPKIPKDAITTESTSVAHTHAPDGATYHLATNATAVGRRTIKNGTGTSYSDNIYTEGGAVVRKTATAGMSANATHTHKLPSADYSITNRTTDGAVNGVQTTSHQTMSTGDSGNLQPYVVVIRWHRTA